ncbi:MAG: hypothetical protein R3B82_29610 [Sandaracinaceae bacterium]
MARPIEAKTSDTIHQCSAQDGSLSRGMEPGITNGAGIRLGACARIFAYVPMDFRRKPSSSRSEHARGDLVRVPRGSLEHLHHRVGADAEARPDEIDDPILARGIVPERRHQGDRGGQVRGRRLLSSKI